MKKKTTKPDGREKRAQRTRQKIRKAAGVLFVQKGVEHTTVDDIAAAAGIAKATFYLHFSRKEDLVLEYAQQRLIHAKNLLPELLLKTSALDAIEEMVAVVLKGRDWNRQLVKLILLELEASHHRLHTHDLRQILLPLVELGAARGEIRADIGPPKLATFIADSIYNALRNWGMELCGERLDRELDDAVVLAFDAVKTPLDR